MATHETRFVCSKCGRKLPLSEAKVEGWLIAVSKRGRGAMVIRCAEHISNYARRMAR